MTTRKYSANVIEDIYKEINDLKLKIDRILSNEEITAPFRDSSNFPPGVEGQIVIAEGIEVASSVLYAAKGGNTASDLYTIDPATAVETSVGPTGVALTGLAFDPVTGILYGVSSQASPGGTAHKLYSIDKTTGTATLIGTPSATFDIAFAGDEILFGTGSSQIKRINISTASELAYGASHGSVSGGGIAINSTGVAYTSFEGSPKRLEIVDLSTGVLTNIGGISGLSGAAIAAMSFDADDVLWAVALNSGIATLITIDTGTAASTTIGSMANNFDALAWDSVPSPPPPPDPAGTPIGLSWTVTCDTGGPDFSAFNIYRGLTSGSEALLTSVSGSTFTYTDSAVTLGTTYYYKVTAVNSVGESSLSNEVSHVG